MHKIIFLDRDGTINKDEGYTNNVGDYKLLPNTVKGLQNLQNQGYKLIIITNQSGIGRGYYSENQMHKFNKHLLNKLKQDKINIERVLFCPHTPKENCNCRKPKTKLIEPYFTPDFDKNNSYVIGDRASDIELANNAGIKSVLVTTRSAEKDIGSNSTPTFIAEDLLDAANKIQNA
jgi:histidinol-phosphate phosphatase family protein